MSYGDAADGTIYRLEQSLADARAQVAHDARRARVAELKIESVRQLLDNHGVTDSDVILEEIERALTA